MRARRSAQESGNHAVRTTSGRNPFAAKTVGPMNITMTMSCVTRNGGSDCVGASAFRDGTFWKSCALKTKTLR